MTIIFISILILLPILLQMGNQKYLKKPYTKFIITLVSSILIYLLAQIYVLIIDFQIASQLNTFDLNKDGIFAGEEVTLEQEKVINDYINDTGRRLTPITGAIFSILYFILIMIASYIYSIVEKSKTPNK